MGKIILHLDMDAFFASIEQAVNPAFRGQPLIVGSRRKKRYTVVAACSYEAKAFGIKSGMLSVDALRLCPWARFVACDSSRYMYTSDRIARMLKGCAERMERASIDEFYLDLTGLGMDAALERARGIKEWICGEFSITGSIGIAPSRTIAKVAAKARKPDGLAALTPETMAEFLHPLPVEKIPGIGPHITKYLNEEMCVFTVADLAAVSLQRLVKRFGKIGVWLFQVIRGINDDEVRSWREPAPRPKSVGHSYTLEHELHRKQDVDSWIRMLSGMVGYRLRKYGLESRVSHLYVRGDKAVFSREHRFHSPTNDPDELARRAFVILAGFHLGNFGVRGLGVNASGLSASQDLRLFDADRRRGRLLKAIDTINERFGEWSICPAVIKGITS